MLQPLGHLSTVLRDSPNISLARWHIDLHDLRCCLSRACMWYSSSPQSLYDISIVVTDAVLNSGYFVCYLPPCYSGNIIGFVPHAPLGLLFIGIASHLPALSLGGTILCHNISLFGVPSLPYCRNKGIISGRNQLLIFIVRPSSYLYVVRNLPIGLVDIQFPS